MHDIRTGPQNLMFILSSIIYFTFVCVLLFKIQKPFNRGIKFRIFSYNQMTSF